MSSQRTIPKAKTSAWRQVDHAEGEESAVSYLVLEGWQ